MTDLDVANFRTALIKKREEILALKDPRQQSQQTVERDGHSLHAATQHDAMARRKKPSAHKIGLNYDQHQR